MSTNGAILPKKDLTYFIDYTMKNNQKIVRRLQTTQKSEITPNKTSEHNT
jgi:hypothetical protein